MILLALVEIRNYAVSISPRSSPAWRIEYSDFQSLVQDTTEWTYAQDETSSRADLLSTETCD